MPPMQKPTTAGAARPRRLREREEIDRGLHVAQHLGIGEPAHPLAGVRDLVPCPSRDRDRARARRSPRARSGTRNPARAPRAPRRRGSSRGSRTGPHRDARSSRARRPAPARARVYSPAMSYEHELEVALAAAREAAAILRHHYARDTKSWDKSDDNPVTHGRSRVRSSHRAAAARGLPGRRAALRGDAERSRAPARIPASGSSIRWTGPRSSSSASPSSASRSRCASAGSRWSA